jgi:hypothetical protein
MDRPACNEAAGGDPKKLLAHAEQVFGSLPDHPAAKPDVKSVMASTAAALARASAPKQSTPPPQPSIELLPENDLAWDVVMVMIARRQYVLSPITFMAAPLIGSMPVGGAKPFAFKFESLQFVFDVMVPAARRREVFGKFLLLEPYAINWLRSGG